MIRFTRYKMVDCDSVVVIKCQRCDGINLHIAQNYAPKSKIKRLRCKTCDHAWDVTEDSHMGYEEVH